MKVKGCVVFAWLILGIFNQRAVACVTADTDLSGGGWETSAATDPCSLGARGMLQGTAQFPSDPPSSAHNGAATFVVQGFVWGEPTSRPISLLLLVMASCFGFTRCNQHLVATTSGAVLLPDEVGL
jgi:hypothetical protein